MPGQSCNMAASDIVSIPGEGECERSSPMRAVFVICFLLAFVAAAALIPA
jgi:hypothetical protein